MTVTVDSTTPHDDHAEPLTFEQLKALLAQWCDDNREAERATLVLEITERGQTCTMVHVDARRLTVGSGA